MIESDNQYVQFEHRIQLLEMELKDSKQTEKNLRSINEAILENLKNFSNDNRNFKLSNDFIQSIENKLDQSHVIDDYKSQIQNYKHECNNYKLEVEQFKNEITQQQKTIQLLQQKYNNECNNQQQEIELFKNELIQQQNIIQQLQTQYSGEKNQSNSLIQTIDKNIVESQSEYKIQFQQKEQEYQKIIKILQTDNQQLQKSIKQYLGDDQQFQSESLEQLKKNQQKIIDQMYLTQQKEIQTVIKSFQKEKEEFQQNRHLIQKFKELFELEQKQKISIELAKNNQIKELTDTIDSMKIDFANFICETRSTNEKFKNVELKNKDQQEIISNQKKQIESLQNLLNQKELLYEQNLLENSTKNQQNQNQLHEDISQMKQTIESLCQELIKQKEINKLLNNDIENKKISQLKNNEDIFKQFIQIYSERNHAKPQDLDEMITNLQSTIGFQSTRGSELNSTKCILKENTDHSNRLSVKTQIFRPKEPKLPIEETKSEVFDFLNQIQSQNLPFKERVKLMENKLDQHFIQGDQKTDKSFKNDIRGMIGKLLKAKEMLNTSDDLQDYDHQLNHLTQSSHNNISLKSDDTKKYAKSYNSAYLNKPQLTLANDF